MKKEIHLRIIRRLAAVFVLASLLITGGAFFLEYLQLDARLLSFAEKESSAFSTLFGAYHEAPEQQDQAALQFLAAAAMERTSFVQAELFTSSREQVLIVSQPRGEEVAGRYEKKGISLPFSDQPDGVRLITNKRIFLQVMLPIHGLSNGGLIGYFRGIYRVSLEDMQPLIKRFLWSAALGVAGVLLCSLLLYPGMVLLHNHLIRSTAELNKANGFLLRTLGSTLAKTDTSDSGHNHRVVIYAVRLAEQQGLTRTQIRSLIHGAFLHDIGMLPVNIATLLSESEPAGEELDLIRKHPRNGAALIKKIRWLRSAEPVLRCHHENYDGSGYPAALAHEKIPFIAKIFRIADVFDALVSNRPGRAALPLAEALRNLEKASGTHFDPVLLAAFLDRAPRLYQALADLEAKQLDRELDKVLKRYMKT